MVKSTLSVKPGSEAAWKCRRAVFPGMAVGYSKKNVAKGGLDAFLGAEYPKH
jgi:hypothetical protein